MTRNRLSVVLLSCFVSLSVLLPSIIEEGHREPSLSEESDQTVQPEVKKPEVCVTSAYLISKNAI
ncbi:hypothetical protein ACX93W_25255 [Paenibacillus sp. CAU 1782]